MKLNSKAGIFSGFLTTCLMMAAPTLALAEGESKPGGKSVIDVILHGGPLIIMVWIAILATSIVMVTFIIQNLLSLRNERLAPTPLVDSLNQTLNAGNYQEAWEICTANRNYLSNVLRSALERLGRGKDPFEDALADQAAREGSVMRTRNSYLSVIGVISPMIGLLGTVIGMMGAFQHLGSGGMTNPGALAASIGEVLLATASGLFIAIPAFIFYYFFRNRIQAVIVYAEDRINQLVEDIPFEELQGIRVGERFSAGVATPTIGAGGSRKVSMALTTNCPVCSNAVTPGQNPCPHCGATLEWA